MPYRDPAKRELNRLKRRKRNYGWMIDYKTSRGCADCGEDDPVVLTFHHVDPDEKDMCVSNLAYCEYSLERLKAEVEKCVVLCFNCHMREHNGHKEIYADTSV